MRLAFTSDLHVEYHLEVVGLVARRARELAPDALVLVGDLCPDLRRLELCLRLLGQELDCPLLFLPGNHDLWCGGPQTPGPHSRERYEQVIPELARRAGALPLGLEPAFVGDVAVVGVTGWHDGSLSPTHAGALRADSEPHGADDPAQVVCLDDTQVFWPDDEGRPLRAERISELMCSILRRQMDSLRAHSGALVVATHMLPHPQVLEAADPPQVQDGAAPAQLAPFLGSAALWPIIAEHPRVALALAGHLHRPSRTRIPGGIGEILCQVSPIGYPRERFGTLEDQVCARLSVLELGQF